MSEKKMDITVSKTDTVENTLKQWAIDKAELNRENAGLKEELAILKKANCELKAVIETDLKADALARITQRSNFTRSELEDLDMKALQQIEATLSKTKGADATYKQIRAGTVSEPQARGTVGNLFGKSHKEILAMGGDF